MRSQCAGEARRLFVHDLSEVSRKYNWDKSGRLKGVQDNRRGTSSYHYDPRDQIERITRQAGLKSSTEEHYSYDELMNITIGNGHEHRYEGGVVRSIGQTTYRYDSRGRTIEKNVQRNGFRPKIWRYLWDHFDRMVEAHTPDGNVWRYSYDAFGRRIRKECVKAGERSQKQAIVYIWQGATLAEEITSSGQTTRWHFEPETFHPLAKETNGSFFPIVTDHLGTPKELFDTEGNVLWQAEHALWGHAETTAKKTDNYQPIVGCNLRFQNQWEDEESGLYYNLNRYYDPDSGQYLSPDPIGLEGGLRTHGYVHDPMLWTDPLGLAGCGKKPSVADEAASWQGKGRYPGVDNWRNTTLKKGTIVYGVTPGQSQFYTTKTSFTRTPKRADVIGRRLQVEPHIKFGYRREMTAYEVMEDTPAARSVVKANPQFGEGGMSEVYIPDYETTLTPLYKVPLR